MSSRPQTVTDVQVEPALAAVTLTWTPLGWEPLIDHFRIYAVRGGSAPSQVREADLLAKTVYPRFVHDGLDPAGEQWTYVIIAVSDAGRRGKSSDPVTATSQASVTATGREVGAIGTFDGKSLEFQFAPSSYSSIPDSHPDALIEYRQGTDVPASGWPYLLPGPGDAWAGYRAYRARWTFELADELVDDLDLAVWLIDTTRLGGLLRISANGEQIMDLDLPPGATRGSREGDATVPGSTLRRSFHELPVPASTLRVGENMIEFHLVEGGWLAWDAVGLFAR